MRIVRAMIAFALLAGVPASHAQAPDPATIDATALVREAINHWRGLSSQSDITMVIHRPDWERTMSMRAWTRGDDQSLVRVLEPARDRGNGTLTEGNSMWSYSPKVNRVIKIPSSMMSQSWMGSDFSNKDVAKADDIVEQYTHTLLDVEERDGQVVYVVQSIPLEEAAVVWGREVLTIRDDFIVVEHRFYDQDNEAVKVLETLEIDEMGGRQTATRQRMSKVDAPEEWTEIRVHSVEYDLELRDSVFTLSNLRNPRD
jgi:outer membrane lipoprotein-sorting protein